MIRAAVGGGGGCGGILLHDITHYAGSSAAATGKPGFLRQAQSARHSAALSIRRAHAPIRAIFEQEGELSAAIELRRRFPGVTDNGKARACARSIAGWTPLRAQPRPVMRMRPRKDS